MDYYINLYTIMDEASIQNFKCLLEYFTTHLNYIQTDNDNIPGYNTYLDEYVRSKTFMTSGQGYNDAAIQNQIKRWDNYNGNKICINIQCNYGSYTTKKCYLNWKSTGINIFAQWDGDKISSLVIGYCFWWEESNKYKVIESVTIEDLGLYGDSITDNMVKFYKAFENEIVNYKGSCGTYYEKEQKYYNEQRKKKIMETNKQYVEILINNYNLILTGAPGTGKTYLAKQIAEILEARGEKYGFVQFHPSYDYTDFIEGLRPIKNNANKEIGFERKDGIFMSFCRKALKAYQSVEDKNDAPKYVFVIDEINRGEMSKIFGELFFSIDPGYRGTDGRISTQYSNLWSDEDVFDNTLEGDDKYKFYIPKNVFIIGTMNDIDRSVESMDFAMRRRFAFKEVKAETRLQMINESDKLHPFFDEIKERMENLNLCILTIQGLSSAYQIGASYYLKLKNYLTDNKSGNNNDNKKLPSEAWTNLWENHLSGLLFEYLRGMPDAENILQGTLYHAYTLHDRYTIRDGKAIKIDNSNENE